LAAFAYFDQFGDINEMILYAMPAVKTGRLGLFDDLFKIAVIRVSENLCKVPARPVFIAGVVRSLNLFEWRIIPAPRRPHYLINHNLTCFL
jgi:hypothetical protein